MVLAKILHAGILDLDIYMQMDVIICGRALHTSVSSSRSARVGIRICSGKSSSTGSTSFHNSPPPSSSQPDAPLPNSIHPSCLTITDSRQNIRRQRAILSSAILTSTMLSSLRRFWEGLLATDGKPVRVEARISAFSSRTFIFELRTGLALRPPISSLLRMKVTGFGMILDGGLQIWTMLKDPQRSTRLRTGCFPARISTESSTST